MLRLLIGFCIARLSRRAISWATSTLNTSYSRTYCFVHMGSCCAISCLSFGPHTIPVREDLARHCLRHAGHRRQSRIVPTCDPFMTRRRCLPFLYSTAAASQTRRSNHSLCLRHLLQQTPLLLLLLILRVLHHPRLASTT